MVSLSYVILKTKHFSSESVLWVNLKGDPRELSLCAALPWLVACPENSNSPGQLALSAQSLWHMVCLGSTWVPPTKVQPGISVKTVKQSNLRVYLIFSRPSRVIILCCLLSRVLKMVVSCSFVLLLLFLITSKSYLQIIKYAKDYIFWFLLVHVISLTYFQLLLKRHLVILNL